MTKVRIAVVDDDAEFLKRLADFFNVQPHLSCTIAGTSVGALLEDLTAYQRVDILLLDIKLAKGESIEHIQKIKKLLPDTKIIMMTGFSNHAYVIKSLQMGADGYFIKGGGIDKLLSVIDRVVTEGTYFSPAAAQALLQHVQQSSATSTNVNWEQEPSNSKDLTNREREVAEGLTRGMSYKEIAAKHFISINTVRYYVKVLYSKMNVSTKFDFIKEYKNYLNK